jgi:fused signal recognition particle receptor
LTGYDQGVARTRQGVFSRLRGVFGRQMDDAAWEEVEEALIAADIGATLAARVVEKARSRRDIDDAQAAVEAELLALFAPRDATPWPRIPAPDVPAVVLVVGVNGTGKTTTIGKLAKRLTEEGAKVTLAAGDTFRAAAIEQLKVWAERAHAQFVATKAGGDAAGLAFEALERARGDGSDILLIDTAGRLQNKAGLMAELEKIARVIKKLDASAPHAVLLVLDATTGQNAISQVEAFSASVPVTGLVMTKLDGTAKGGILVALAGRFGLPVHYIGVGEGEDDLQPFVAADFARALVGAEES